MTGTLSGLRASGGSLKRTEQRRLEAGICNVISCEAHSEATVSSDIYGRGEFVER